MKGNYQVHGAAKSGPTQDRILTWVESICPACPYLKQLSKKFSRPSCLNNDHMLQRLSRSGHCPMSWTATAGSRLDRSSTGTPHSASSPLHCSSSAARQYVRRIKVQAGLVKPKAQVHLRKSTNLLHDRTLPRSLSRREMRSWCYCWLAHPHESMTLASDHDFLSPSPHRLFSLSCL